MEKNPFVQAGALSTDLGEIPHASPFPTPFDQAGAIDGGVDQLKESCAFIPLYQILKATNDFDDALVIGVGGFGKVYKGNIGGGATTTVVAIKRLNVNSRQGAEEFWTEVRVLSEFRHTNLVSLIGYCNENQEMILVYEHMARGNLADHLYKTSTREKSGGSRSHLTWEQRLNICLHAARGLDYLHNGTLCSIIHRDVKSTNILLDEHLVAKVADFGLSKSTTTHTATHVSTNVKGTFGYLDPDYFLTRRITRKSDVYAFGVVLLEVLCGRPTIDVRLEEEQISLAHWAQMNIKKGKLDRIIDPSLSGDTTRRSLKYFAELANKCLQYQPKKRPTMAEVVESLKIALVSHERKGRSQGTTAKAWTLGSLLSRRRNPLLVPSPEIQKSSITVNGGGKPTKLTMTAFLVANSKPFDDFEARSKETFMIHQEKLVKKEEGFTNEHLSDHVFANSKKNKGNNKTVNKFYSKRGRGRWDSMELKHSATFKELEMDPENKNNRAYHSGVLVSNSKKRKTIKALKRLQGSLVSILRLEDYNTPLPYQLTATLLGMSKIIPGFLSICGDEQIIEPTTNHIHKDRVDVALLRPLNFDLYIHKSSPQPKALPDGGESVLLDSSKQKPSVDFDATNNRAFQSDVLVSSRRQCMPEGVLSLVDSTTTISSTDFDAPDNSAHLVRAYQSGHIFYNSEKKDMGEGLNRECLTNSSLSLEDSTKPRSLLDFDATENKAVKVYTRQGRGCWHSMELEQRTMLEELGMHPENEGIISDLLRFVRDKEELYKEAGKDWKRGYLLDESPGTDRSSLIAAMANCLEFDIYVLDLTGLSSISELTNVLVSIRNRSLIAIKDLDQWFGMLRNLKNELTLSSLLKIIHGLLLSCGDERIIVLSTNHNHIGSVESVDTALLRSLNIDLYIHTSSPQPKALPDRGAIVLLDSSEQKPLDDFYPTNNRAYQSDILVPNSEDKKKREASRRQCMPERVLSLVDSMARISSMDFEASDNRVHLVRAYQSGPVVFNLEKKDMREVLSRECLSKSVLSLDDSSKQKSLLDFAVTEKKSHLVRAYPSGPVVSFSDDKNGGEALKRECITKSILGLEDLQQHSGGRCDDAAKSFCAIYDPGIHTADSLARISFEVLETLPTREEPNDCVPLLSLGRLTLEDCVQPEKSLDLPRVTQINGVEQRVTKLPRYFGGLTAQSASSSRWPISLPDGGRIVLLDPLNQSTKHIEHVGRADQWSPTLSLPERKMVRKTLKRKCRTMSAIFEDNHQHFARRCEGDAKSLGVTHIFRKHGIHQVSAVKQIKQHSIPQWPFFRQKWATRKGYSLGEERPFEVSHLSMDEKLDSRLQLIHMSQFARSSPRALALPDGGEICRPTALSRSSELSATNNISHLVGQDQSGSTASHYECKNTRETSDKQGLEDLEQHFGCIHKDAVKSLGVSGSMFKSACMQHWVSWWPGWFENNDSLAWKSFKVLDSLPFGEQSNSIRRLARRRTLTHKHCVRLKKSQDLQRFMLRDCLRGLFAQSDIGLPDGGHILSLSKKKNVRKTLKRKCRTMSVLSLEDHQQRVGRRWEDAVKCLGAKRICRQLAIHRETTVNCIRRQLGTRKRPFKQSAIGLPDGGHIRSLSEKKIVRKTLKRKCRSLSVLSLEDHKQHVDRRWEGAVKSHGAKRICRQLVIHRSSTAKHIRKEHGIHRWPFQRSFIGLPDGGHILPLSEKKILRKTLKRKCRGMSVLSLVDRQQHVDRRWEDAAKNIGVKLICGQLVIHRVSIAKRIYRRHGIYHRWPFQQDWATMKGYSLGDEIPVEVISLSTHAKLVPRLQLIYISWLGRFSPRPSALAGGGGIGGPIALSLSESAATKNIAQRVGQDQSGSAASDSENERTREQEDLEEIHASITKDDLRQLYGRMNRKDAAASLGVSESTFKRKCREYEIKRWPHVRKRKVGRPPDQHGEGNTSTTRETPSHHVQTGMEGELVGQNVQRDFMGCPIALNTESGLIMVSRPPDQHGERNTSTTCGMPSHNVEIGMEVEPVGQNQEANVYRRDFMNGPIALNTDGLTFPECSDAVAPSQPMATILDAIPHLNGGSSECAFQVKNQSTQFTANPYPNGLVDPHPQIALTQILSEDMERLEDRRNLLAPQKEPLPEGHVFGSVNWTVRSCSDVALSQPMPTIPDTTGCSEYWRNSLALLEGHLLEENYGSINLTAPSCFDPGPSQPMHAIPHTMPTIPQMMPLLTERQDMSFVRLKATYGNTTIKFPLPSGFSELKEEVSKRLEFERGSFKLEYKDEEGDSVLIACDEDVRDYLRLLTSLGNQVIKLFVLDKVPNTTNFCDNCGCDNCRSLKCKRP